MSEEYSIPPEISIYRGEPIGNLSTILEEKKAKKNITYLRRRLSLY